MLVLAIGGHWAVLQSVAWVRMAVRFSEQAPLGQALRMTFDGKHPCKLCKAVQEGRHSAQQESSGQSGPKLDLVCFSSVPVLVRQPVSEFVSSQEKSSAQRSEPPSHPPPRRG
jgi:hypothetical protein